MSENLNVQLGLRIRYLRLALEMSLEDLALECEINKNYLCDVENGRRNPTLKILKKIASGLKVFLTELFQGLE